MNDLQALDISIMIGNHIAGKPLRGTFDSLVAAADVLMNPVQRVLAYTNLHGRMSTRGKAQTVRFTWEETAQRTVAVYESAYANAHIKEGWSAA